MIPQAPTRVAKAFASLIEEPARPPVTARGIFRLRWAKRIQGILEVEAVAEVIA